MANGSVECVQFLLHLRDEGKVMFATSTKNAYGKTVHQMTQKSTIQDVILGWSRVSVESTIHVVDFTGLV